jgi:hypothetical protein
LSPLLIIDQGTKKSCLNLESKSIKQQVESPQDLKIGGHQNLLDLEICA